MQLQGLWLGIEVNEPTIPGSLDQRSTNWATEAIAVSLIASSVYIYIGGNASEVWGYIKDNIWHLNSLTNI